MLEAYALPRDPFVRLIAANRWDQRLVQLETFDELLDYCALSANPVGELVLCIFAAATSDNVAHSDQICSALQVVEHLQDVAEDRVSGRVYLPAEDMERFSCSPDDLVAVPASAPLRQLVAFEAARARDLLSRGEPLLSALAGSARLAVAGFAAGGHAALDAIERADCDVTSELRRPTRRGVLFHAARLWLRAGRSGAGR